MNYTKQICGIILILATSGLAFGSAAGHGEEGIPYDKIMWQAVNLGILLVGIFLLIRKSIVGAFKNRQLSYVDRAEKTKSALKEAEATLAEIKNKLATLEAGEEKALRTAKEEAEAMKAQMIRDAAATAEKIIKEAELVVGAELLKAKAEINQLILDGAVVSAKKTLAGVSASEAQEAGFIKQIEQVKS